MNRSLLIVIGIAGMTLMSLGGRGFWDPDEPRFAQTSREMMQGGDWIVPHFNGRPLPLLPPLTYWASATASLAHGDVVESTARLPVNLFALLALLGTALVVPSAGTWSALVLLTSVKFLHQAQYLQSDMLLVGSQTWALAAFYRAQDDTRRRRLWQASGYVAIAAGILTKGPIGALVPAAVFGSYLVVERDLRALARLGLGWGVPLVAALALPWYFAACAREGEAFCTELVLKQNLGMFFDTWSHARPFYYYAIQLPWMFLPWTLILPIALWRTDLDRDARFALTWAGVCLIFFSASDAKQAKYLLPMLPPLAILVGRWIAEGRDSRASGVAGLALALIFACAALACLVSFPEEWASVAPGAATTLGAAAALAASAWFLRAKPRESAALLGSCVLGAAIVGRVTLVPAIEPFKTPDTLVRRAASLEWPLAIYGIAYRQTGGLVYATGHPLPLIASQQAFGAYLASPGPRLAYVSTKAGAAGALVLAESPYRGGTLLVSNQEVEP